MKIHATIIVDNIAGGFIRRTYLAGLMLGLMTLLAFTGCQTPGPEFKGAGAPSANPSGAIALREGDVLKITFPGAPNLDTTQAIRADGKLVLPVVGEITVAGMTPTELEKDLINRYSSQARGVIVMRLNAGDKVVGIAAFHAGLAQRDGLADNETEGTKPDPESGKPK